MNDLLHLAQTEVDLALKRLLDIYAVQHQSPPRLHEALSYVLLAPGKRLRPALVLAAAKFCGRTPASVMIAACAIEMVHAYSLVHDDLPALDNDDMRRGRPSCHKRFDEATAILVGDTLLTEGLALFTADTLWDSAKDRLAHDSQPISLSARMAALTEIVTAIGIRGMIGGQYDDLFVRRPTAEQSLACHRRKTAVLIRAALRMGAQLAEAPAQIVETLGSFGEDLGMAFQLRDDLADNDGHCLIAGRPQTTALAEQFLRAAKNTLSELSGDTSEFLQLMNKICPPDAQRT